MFQRFTLKTAFHKSFDWAYHRNLLFVPLVVIFIPPSSRFLSTDNLQSAFS